MHITFTLYTYTIDQHLEQGSRYLMIFPITLLLWRFLHCLVSISCIHSVDRPCGHCKESGDGWTIAEAISLQRLNERIRQTKPSWNFFLWNLLLFDSLRHAHLHVLFFLPLFTRQWRFMSQVFLWWLRRDREEAEKEQDIGSNKMTRRGGWRLALTTGEH